MKADWEKLMAEFKDSSTALVGDVDCTADGESLCQEVGVNGYPTIKYGDPDDLQDYQGGRSFNDLKSFADTNLGPVCGPKYLDLCDDEKKAEIAKYSAMPSGELDTFIQTAKDKIEKLEAGFKSFVEGLEKQLADAKAEHGDDAEEVNTLLERLRKQYKEESDKKDASMAEVKASGMALAKAVKSFAASKTEL